MKKTFSAVALLFAVCSMFITSCSQPAKQKTLDKILTDKIIVVGTTGEQFPFTFKDDDGKLKGIDIRIANHLAKELGVAIKYEVMNFDELIPSVISGKVDIVFSGVSITSKRNTKVAFPGVYFKSGKSILSKDKKISKGEDEDVNTEEVTLATTKSTTSETFVKSRFPKAKLILVNNNSEALQLLKENKVNGIVADYETCETIAFSYEESYLYYENISKPNLKEFLSPVVAADDYLFINLLSNYIDRVNSVDKSDVIDNILYDFMQ